MTIIYQPKDEPEWIIGGSKPTIEERCAASVQEVDAHGYRYQCRRKRGYGKNGLYCKQHANKYTDKVDELQERG